MYDIPMFQYVFVYRMHVEDAKPVMHVQEKNVSPHIYTQEKSDCQKHQNCVIHHEQIWER